MGSRRVSEMWDPSEYWKRGIRVSAVKVGSEQVPEKGPGEYWKGGIW